MPRPYANDYTNKRSTICPVSYTHLDVYKRQVQKYGEVLDEPLTAEINGRTVSVNALLRVENTLRVLYDVDTAQGMAPNDLVWDTGEFYLRAADNSGDKRLYIASNAQVRCV